MIRFIHCPFIWALILFITKNINASLENSIHIMKKSNEVSDVLGIFLNCVIRETHNVIFIGDWIDDDFSHLNQRLPYFTVLNLDKFNEKVALYNRENYSKFHFINKSTIAQKKPARYIALKVSNSSQLMLILEDLRLSIYWDNNAVFLLIDKNEQRECKQARMFLNIIWDFNILSAVYTCITSNNKLFTYTFNPFAPLAPYLWKKVETFMPGTNKSTLFQLAIDGSSHVNNSSFCKKWFFDKTKNLNNHNIKASFIEFQGMNKYDDTKIGLSRFMGYPFDIFYAIITSMKATVTFKFYVKLTYIDKHGNGQGLFKDLENGTVDYFIAAMFIRDYWYMQTFPYFNTGGLCFSTMKDPILLTGQFLSIIHSTIFFIFLFMMLVSVMLQRYFLNVPVLLSALECLRMLTGTATINKPKTDLGKIFLIINLLTFWLQNCNLQSFVNLFYTVPQYYPSIDTYDDLIKSNLKIYGLSTAKQVILNKKLQDRYEAITNPTECFHRLLKAERICCFAGCEYTKIILEETKYIHTSYKHSMFLPEVYTFRKDWHLSLKYNHIMLKLFEAGIITWFRKENIERFVRNYHSTSSIDIEKHHDKRLLTICWLILLWGFVLSCFTFIVEYLHSNMTNVIIKISLYLKNKLLTLPFSYKSQAMVHKIENVTQ